MKRAQKILVVFVSVVTTFILLFLVNFNFFCSPQIYTLADGTKIEYHTTRTGNCYVIENFRFEKVAIPIEK